MFGRPGRIVGIDISDASVEVVEMEHGRALAVRALGRVTIPPGVVERGVIRDVNQLAAALSAVLEKAAPSAIGATQAVVNLPEEQVFTRRITVPTSSREEMLRSAQQELEASVPYPIEDLVWDAVPVAEQGGKTVLLVAATQKVVYDAFAAALRAVRREPFAFASDALALAQAYFRGLPKAPIMIVDIGTVTAAIAIFDADGLYASVNVAVGGQTLTAAVASKFGLAHEDAEAHKRRAGFDPDAEQGKVFLVLQNAVLPLVEAAEGLRTEYTDATGNAPSSLLLSGGSAALPGIGEYLGNVLALPVRAGSIIADIETAALPPKAREALKDSPGLFAVAIGLAEYGFLPTAERLSFSAEKRILEAAAEDFGEVRKARADAPSGKKSIPTWLVAAIVIVWLAAMAGATVLYLRYSSARGPEVAAPADEQTAPEEQGVRTFEFPLAVRVAGAAKESEIAGTLITEEREGETRLALTDVRPGGKSRGSVTIVNGSDTSQRLVAGTRLLSAGGILFRLVDTVTVPVGGTLGAVAIEADAAGESGDIAPSAFTIPGLSKELQRLVTAQSTVGLVGGGSTGMLTESVIRDAEAALIQEIASVASTTIRSKLAPETVFPSDLIERVTVSSSSPPAGTVPEKSAVMRLRMRFATIAVSEEDLVRASRVAVAEQVGAKEASLFTFRSWKLAPVAYDAEKGVATLTVTVQGARE